MSNTPLPTIALSIRGLWAWLVANGFKDFEIRDWKRRNPARQHVVLASLMGRAFDVLIHASSGCTIREYEAAMITVHHVNKDRQRQGLPLIKPPYYGQLERGGIIGVMTVTGWSDRATASPWSIGSGLTLSNARPLPFRPCAGKLGAVVITPRLTSALTTVAATPSPTES